MEFSRNTHLLTTCGMLVLSLLIHWRLVWQRFWKLFPGLQNLSRIYIFRVTGDKMSVLQKGPLVPDGQFFPVLMWVSPGSVISDSLVQKGKHNIKSVSTQLKSFSTFAPQGVTLGCPEHFNSWSEKCRAYTTLSAPITRLFPGFFSFFLWSTGLEYKSHTSVSVICANSFWVKPRSEIATNL